MLSGGGVFRNLRKVMKIEIIKYCINNSITVLLYHYLNLKRGYLTPLDSYISIGLEIKLVYLV